MKISIITVCKNAEKTIERTIISIINQSCRRDLYEYIIIDGVSTDHTMNIIDKYKDNIDLIVSEPDKGIYDAMNKGIRLAKGEYIAFMNSDDWYETNALSDVERTINVTHADVIYGDTNYINKDGSTSLMKHQKVEKIWEDMVACHQSTFVKKEWFGIDKAGLFDLKYRVAADFNFLQIAYIKGAKFYGIDATLSNYTLGGESEKLLKTYYDDYTNIILEHSKFCPNGSAVVQKQMKRAEMYYFQRALSKDPNVLEIYLGQTVRERTVYVWGTGIWGGKVTDMLNHQGLVVSAYIDSNFIKIGKVYNNAYINSPQMIKEIDGRAVVIIAVRNKVKEITDEIRKINYNKENVSLIFIDDLIMEIVENEKNKI